MADARDLVRLIVDGLEFGGWKSVRIEAGIERQARSFDLEVTEKWPGNLDIARRIQPGQVAQVFIGPDLVVTGYIDATPRRYDGHSLNVAVKGRSKTADLIDCSPVDAGGKSGGGGGSWGDVIGRDGKTQPVAKPGAAGAQYRQQRLEAIAATLAAPYGIRVIAEVDTGAVIADHTVQAGETVFESIERMMRLRHVLSTDNEKGDLVFIEVGSGGRAGTMLEVGQNIRSGAADLDFKDVFSEYVCKGQRPGMEAVEDDEPVETFSESEAQALDTTVKRYRRRVFKQCGAADEGTCDDRVTWEKAHRKAKALAASYVVAGWRQADGTLWRPNTLVRVKDPVIGIDTEMLIAEVCWSLSAEGLRTDIKVGPPDGYVTKAAKLKKGKGGTGGGGWGDVK